MRHIAVVGAGYVGVTTAIGLASLGYRVIVVDIDGDRIAQLQQGQVPFYEPGLPEMLREMQLVGRLSFTTSYQAALHDADIAFVAVGTPSGDRGEADLSYMRIGRAFLQAGLGFGGSCFPKDVKALRHTLDTFGCNTMLVDAILGINAEQRQRAIQVVERLLGGLSLRTVAVLGLAFKPNTSDVRESPGLEIVRLLHAGNALVRAHDPVVGPQAVGLPPAVAYFDDVYEMVTDCDAIIIATEWDEYKKLDLPRLKELMRQPVLVDGRNIFEPARMLELGFCYRGIGRGHMPSADIISAHARCS